MKGLPRSLAHAPFNQPTEPYVRKVRYQINHTLTVAAAAAGVGFGSVVIGDFPEGNILLLGRAAQFSCTTASANITNLTYTPTFAVGSAPTAAGALTGTEVDIFASRANTIAAAKTSPLLAHFLAATDNVSAALNNRDGLMELNLNLQIPAADITDATSAAFTVTGWLELAYAVLGDA